MDYGKESGGKTTEAMHQTSQQRMSFVNPEEKRRVP